MNQITEQELSDNVRFEQWNNEQQERYKIKNRTTNFTKELPEIIIGQRIMCPCPIFQQLTVRIVEHISISCPPTITPFNAPLVLSP